MSAPDLDRDTGVMERSFIDALMSKDRAALLGLVHPLFVGISHTGREVDRDQYLTVYLRPNLTFAQYETTGVAVRSHGPVALRAGIVLIRRTGEPGPVEPKRYLASWFRGHGDHAWSLTSWQDTPVTDAGT